jgi:hypothetical protein
MFRNLPFRFTERREGERAKERGRRNTRSEGRERVKEKGANIDLCK